MALLRNRSIRNFAKRPGHSIERLAKSASLLLLSFNALLGPINSTCQPALARKLVRRWMCENRLFEVSKWMRVIKCMNN